MQLCRIATTYFSRRTRSRSSVCKADRRHNANNSEAERMRLLSDGMLTNIPESTSLNICMILFFRNLLWKVSLRYWGFLLFDWRIWSFSQKKIHLIEDPWNLTSLFSVRKARQPAKYFQKRSEASCSNFVKKTVRDIENVFSLSLYRSGIFGKKEKYMKMFCAVDL